MIRHEQQHQHNNHILWRRSMDIDIELENTKIKLKFSVVNRSDLKRTNSKKKSKWMKTINRARAKELMWTRDEKHWVYCSQRILMIKREKWAVNSMTISMLMWHYSNMIFLVEWNETTSGGGKSANDYDGNIFIALWCSVMCIALLLSLIFFHFFSVGFCVISIIDSSILTGRPLVCACIMFSCLNIIIIPQKFIYIFFPSFSLSAVSIYSTSFNCWVFRKILNDIGCSF